MEMQLYFFWSSISMAIFYLFYLLLLRRETFFLVNRIYLLSALSLSIVLPLIDFSVLMPLPKMELMFSSLPITGNGKLTIVDEKNYSWLSTIYYTGVLLTSIWLLIKLFGVKRQIKRAESGSAFSFWKTKVIDQDLSNFSAINAHEDIHVTQLHTLDILLIEVIGIFFWFNPLIYSYSRSLKLIHEYQADDHAASFAESKRQYAMMLFLQNFKAGPILTNSFNSPFLLEARIKMLQRKKSNSYQVLKYILVMPLMVLLITLCSFRSGYLNGGGTNKIDKAATFQGGFSAFSEYLLKNTRNDSKTNGRVVVSFIVDIEGKIDDARIDSSLNETCDNEALRVIKLSPKWIPALKNGKKIRSAYQIGLNFKSDNQ